MNLPIEVKLSVSYNDKIHLTQNSKVEVIDPAKYAIYYEGNEVPPDSLGNDGDVYLRWAS